MMIAEILSERSILFSGPEQNLRKLQETLVKMLCEEHGLADGPIVLAKFLEMDQIQCNATLETGLRTTCCPAHLDGLHRLAAALAVIPRGIPDPKDESLMINAIFLVLAPPRTDMRQQLFLLRQSTHLFGPGFIQRLASTRDPRKAYRLIRAKEAKISGGILQRRASMNDLEKTQAQSVRSVSAAGQESKVASTRHLLLGDFAVERELGEGGLGKVYLVKSQSTKWPFAMKIAKLPSEANRRLFLAELQLWIDLPEHPNIVTCRFFRTVGDEIAIFADHLEGGSLSDWIKQRRLTHLDSILDVAIQFAWGLYAIHEHGVIHQDVKPANAMMTPGGNLCVGDFGLARARAKAGEDAELQGAKPFVSCGGLTPAYCSPEQWARQPLTRVTDVWSWGLSVLEMFKGAVTWHTGMEAPKVLEDHLRTGPADARLPAMPPSVAKILMRCFRPDPAEREASLAKVAQELMAVSRDATGKNYPRRPPVPASPVRAVQRLDRKMLNEATERDPREWLVWALRTAGRDPAEANVLLPPLPNSPEAQQVADIAALQEARHILDGLVAGGKKELESIRMFLCQKQALVHRQANDLPGALIQYDCAIDICLRLCYTEERSDLVEALPALYVSKAFVVAAQGDRYRALALYEMAIEILDRLVNKGGRLELEDQLAEVFVDYGVALSNIGDKRKAVVFYEMAIEILDRLAGTDGRLELENLLATVLMNKGAAASNMGDKRGAVTLYDRANKILERLTNQHGGSELEGLLAKVQLKKANVISAMGDKRGAAALYDRAIEILERLKNQGGVRESENDLSLAYGHKGFLAAELGDMRECEALLGKALWILIERGRGGKADLSKGP